MSMLLAFAPFIAFALLSRTTSSAMALLVAAAIALAMLVHDRIAGRSLKLLEVGTAVLFCGLAALTATGILRLSVVDVRLVVDAGLLAIVLTSLVIGRPFTLQYAIERVPPEIAATPAFHRANTVITGAWAFAFALMVAGGLLLRFEPAVPASVGTTVIVAATAGAVWFTHWYPQRLRRRAQGQPPPAS